MTELRILMHKLSEEVVESEAIRRGPYTIVTITVNHNGSVMRRTGVARRSIVDKPDSDKGQAIARGRALKDLAESLLTERKKCLKTVPL